MSNNNGNAASNGANQRPQRAQIFVVKTDKRVFEMLDGLDVNPKYNKIQLNLVDHEKSPSVFVSHSINPDVLKVIANDILNGRFDGFTEYKGSAVSRREDKLPEARVLKLGLRKPAPTKPDEKINYPFTVTIDTGIGEVIGQGAIKMKTREQSVNMMLSELDMKRFAITALDFIRSWETAQAILRVSATGTVARASGQA